MKRANTDSIDEILLSQADWGGGALSSASYVFDAYQISLQEQIRSLLTDHPMIGGCSHLAEERETLMMRHRGLS